MDTDGVFLRETGCILYSFNTVGHRFSGIDPEIEIKVVSVNEKPVRYFGEDDDGSFDLALF